MKYRQVGNTDIKVSEIGLGCWTIGGLNWKNGYSTGWNNVKESEAIGAISFALEKGVNHFDNADVYGNGKAERLLAKALGNNSKDVIIASKVGHFAGTAENAYEPLHIKHQCEQSLFNLKRDYIDIYYFHHGNFGKNDIYLDEAVDMMYSLKKQGKIRSIGLSAYSTNDFVRLIPKIKPDVLQSWANYMDDKFIKEGSVVSNLIKKNKLSFVSFSVLNRGLLLDKYSSKELPTFKHGDHRENSLKFQKQEIQKVEQVLEKIKKHLGKSKQDLAFAAIQYVLYYKEVCSALIGFRNVKQVYDNLEMIGREFTEQDFDFIKKAVKE
jgi:myo-inositol catabolism protein IolS